jgi:hypothetical protein
MYALSIVAATIVAPLVLAQDATLDIQAIKAHFQQSALVPDLFSSFEPTSIVTLSFSGVGELQPGQQLTQAQVAPVPTVSVTPGNSSTTLSGNYTLAMIDAGTVGEKLAQGQTRHWLVNGVHVSGSTVSNTSAVGITNYAGPAPPAGSGPHRYVVVLYSQPTSFHPPADLSTPGVPVSTFVWADYVTSTGLGPLVGATYFTVEAGTATVSISPTSAVVTQTLPAYSSGSASKASTGVSSTGTPASKSGAVTLTRGHLIALVSLGFLLCVNL